MLRGIIVCVVLQLCQLTFTKVPDLTSCVKDIAFINGCSVPKLPFKFPYVDFFLPACQRHDACYGCGSKYGETRKNCDEAFRRNMQALCRAKHHASSYYGVEHLKEFFDKIKGSFLVGVGLAKWLSLDTGSLAHCMNGANIYFNAVRHFSFKNFEGVQEKEGCQRACARYMANTTVVLA